MRAVASRVGISLLKTLRSGAGLATEHSEQGGGGKGVGGSRRTYAGRGAGGWGKGGTSAKGWLLGRQAFR
jgi:hypothetical protein